jgi:outer membrane protein OmpA-like peptidoglycan-associated protein
MKRMRLLAAVIAVSAALTAFPRMSLAAPDEYDDSQSNPLRFIAYGLYPAGVIAEWVIFRPFHWLVSASRPQEAFFGHHPHPPIFTDPEPGYDFGVPRRVYGRPVAAPRVSAPQEPVAERVTVQQVSVEKTVYQEVPKIVEVERLVFPDIAFRFDSAELTDLGKGKVYLLAQQIKEKGDAVVAIEGHTDSIGTEEYNQRLGMRRAQRVMQELASLGVDASRLTVTSFGFSKPLVDQKTDWARAVNRRVEFRISANTK